MYRQQVPARALVNISQAQIDAWTWLPRLRRLYAEHLHPDLIPPLADVGHVVDSPTREVADVDHSLHSRAHPCQLHVCPVACYVLHSPPINARDLGHFRQVYPFSPIAAPVALAGAPAAITMQTAIP